MTEMKKKMYYTVRKVINLTLVCNFCIEKSLIFIYFILIQRGILTQP